MPDEGLSSVERVPLPHQGIAHRVDAARSQSGGALVIILAFVVLLAGLLLAFLADALNNRKLAGSSANMTKVELFAMGAADTIIADLKQEIAAGSFINQMPGTAGATIYTPITPTNAVPSLVGSSGANGLENLVKRSANGKPFFAGGPSRASAVSSTNASLNGRSISPARWNKPLLMPVTSTTNLAPSAAEFVAPDWILVCRDGSNATSWSAGMMVSPAGDAMVVGRYAYAIYDEGGLLDMNVAGHPLSDKPPYTTNNSDPRAVHKSALAFADLTQLPGISAMTQSKQMKVINSIVGWRNYASAQPSGVLGNFTFTDAASSTNSVTSYASAVLNNSTGFLTTGNKAVYNKQSDRVFASRQQLINFLLQGVGTSTDVGNLQCALMSLGTFSRDVNQPSFSPDPDRPRIVSDAGNLNWPIDYKGGNNAYNADDDDDVINPAFLTIRVPDTVNQSMRRNDGSLLVVGEPLVKTRFPLNYVAWLTYAGPSAKRNIKATSITGADADITLLKSSGFTEAFLRRGTAQSIYDAFGLSWIVDNGVQKWIYNHDGPSPLVGLNAQPTAIKRLEDVAVAGREPDFMELLKAAICAGSKAKSSCSCTLGNMTVPQEAGVWQHKYDTNLDLQIVQIAANIIDQFDGDGYPTLIYFNDGGGGLAPTIAGVENLPYILGERLIMLSCRPPVVTPLPFLTGTISDAGVGAAFCMPELWNPHDQNCSLGVPRPEKYRLFAETKAPDSSAFSLVVNCYAQYKYSFENKTFSFDSPYSPPTIFNADNSEILFELPIAGLFREPVLIGQIDATTGAGLPQGCALAAGACHMIRSAADAAGHSLPGADHGYFTDYTMTRGENPSAWVGFLFGTFPMAFSSPGNVTHSMPAGNYKSNAGTIPGRNDITIKIQSQQPNNQWATYDVHYIPMVSGSQGFGATDNATCWTQFTDPRTARFSAHGRIGWPPPPLCPGNASMTDPPIVFESPRTGADVGLGANFGMPGLQGAIPNPNSIGWFGGPWSSGGNNLFRAGLYSQNDANLLNHPPNIGPYCYADADGVVRRAMGAYVDPSLFLTNNSTGLPIATASTFSNNGVSTPTAQSQSRPFILNRPFRTVTELGYVFSGTPWKNLDFIFPESGDAALLDLFCIREDMTSNAVVAGKVNLNTRNRPVLQSILMQAYKDELSPTGPGQVGASEAGNMTAKLTSRTQSAPLRWLSELVGRFDPSSKTYDGFSADLTTGAFTGTDTNSPRIARFRESALRALVDVGTTRTWTFMIDLIAQTGRYPQSAVHATTPLAAFLVEGEKRYWIHVSIDRMTGQVIDKQIETVSE